MSERFYLILSVLQERERVLIYGSAVGLTEGMCVCVLIHVICVVCVLSAFEAASRTGTALFWLFKPNVKARQ